MAMMQKVQAGCRARAASARSCIAARPARVVVARAAAAPAPAASQAQKANKEWYALVASTEFWFQDAQNEAVAEQLRERVRFWQESNKGELDFYLVPNPQWLDAKYPNEAKKVKRPCVALVTTDKQWAIFMKVRLDRVLRIDLGPVPDAEVLAMGDTNFDAKMQGKWTAPYAPYAPGWWEKFYPKKQ